MLQCDQELVSARDDVGRTDDRGQRGLAEQLCEGVTVSVVEGDDLMQDRCQLPRVVTNRIAKELETVNCACFLVLEMWGTSVPETTSNTARSARSVSFAGSLLYGYTPFPSSNSTCSRCRSRRRALKCSPDRLPCSRPQFPNGVGAYRRARVQRVHRCRACPMSRSGVGELVLEGSTGGLEREVVCIRTEGDGSGTCPSATR